MATTDNLLAPISPDSPCGARLDASELEKIKALRKPSEAANEELYAQQSSTDRRPRVMTRDNFAPGETNKLIASLTTALGTKTKDLQLAAWLTEALTWRHGFAGLAEGLRFLAGLLEAYFDQLHPLADEGDHYEKAGILERIGMVESLKESCVAVALGFTPVTSNGFSLNHYNDSRSIPGAQETGEAAAKRKEALASGKIAPEEFDKAITKTPKPFFKQLKADATECRAALDALEAIATAKFKPAEPPGFTLLKSKLELAENSASILLTRKLQEDPDPLPDPEPEPPPPGDEPPGTEDGQPNPEGPVTVDTGGEPRSRPDAFARVAALARYLRKNDPASPVPYLLVRSLRWGELYGAGADLTDVLLAAPPADVRMQLKKLAAAGQWQQVLELAETSMAAEYGRGWLDLQRYSYKACQALNYKNAARAILLSVKHLLADYPKLPQAILQDDTGAANPETAVWLTTEKAE